APTSAQPNNFLVVRDQYAISYNRDLGTANWTAWHLSRAWFGDAPRQDDFRADDALPPDWHRVTTSSYSQTGFDRGHLCPSADRTLTTVDNSATFFMTNILPQSPQNNQKTWERLESHSRDLAKGGSELYIVAGPFGQGGEGTRGRKETIDGKRIVVPAVTWKVILILRDGADDLRRVDAKCRTLAVIVPNDQSVGEDWRKHQVRVDDVESMTGYDFFSNLPDDVEQTLEGRLDGG
ncbi:MAG: DNA/RNA non-specific endonuclease, partial [Planctomycetia bacterium]